MLGTPFRLRVANNYTKQHTLDRLAGEKHLER